MDEKEQHDRIISFLQKNGPSLTVHLAKAISLDTLFTGALLSELAKEKEILISNTKVGSSPLYFLPGQQSILEKFIKHLEAKEREACVLLKKQGVLEDKQQKPAIRVALRNIKDFAIPFKYNNEMFWKYFTIQEVPEKILKKIIADEERTPSQPPRSAKTPAQRQRPRPMPKPIPAQRPIPGQASRITAELLKQKAEKEIEKQMLEEQKPKIIEKPQPKPKTKQLPIKEGEASGKLGSLGKPKLPLTKKQKPKSEFVLRVINSLVNHNIPVVEEVSAKKKEYNAIIKINSDLGPINVYVQAKDKKRVSVTDLVGVIREAQNRNMIGLFLSPGELNKKAQEYALENNSILKVKQLKQ